MLKIREDTLITPRPSHLSMTTITSTFKVDSLLDIQALKQKMKDTPLIIKKKGSTKPGYLWTVKDNKFFNQITVEYIDKFSKKSIKLFPNGSIHVTGCSDLVDCHRVMAQVKFCILKFTGKIVKTFDFKILMINANFSINSMLNLNMVSSMAEKAGCLVSFKPEIYSAVKIKFVPGPNMKRITASVFSSGCVLITGAQNLREITSSYKLMFEILDDTRIKPHVDLKKFDTFIAISFDSWTKHLLDTK